MTMPPLTARPEHSRRWFAALRELARRARSARSSRWAPARTTRSRSKRARRSCASARACTLERRDEPPARSAPPVAGISRPARWRAGKRLPAKTPQDGIQRLLASRARVLRPGRGVPEDDYDEDEPSSRIPRSNYRDRPNVRRLRRRGATKSTTSSPRMSARSAGAEPTALGRCAAGAAGARRTATCGCTWSRRSPSTTPSRSPTSSRTSIPVILNLQGTDTDLAKRLIDFASGPHLRARRRHAADRRQGLHADAAQRRDLRRGARAADREGLLQPVLRPCPATPWAEHAGRPDRRREHGAGAGARLGRPGALRRPGLGARAGARRRRSAARRSRATSRSRASARPRGALPQARAARRRSRREIAGHAARDRLDPRGHAARDRSGRPTRAARSTAYALAPVEVRRGRVVQARDAVARIDRRARRAGRELFASWARS